MTLAVLCIKSILSSSPDDIYSRDDVERALELSGLFVMEQQDSSSKNNVNNATVVVELALKGLGGLLLMEQLQQQDDSSSSSEHVKATVETGCMKTVVQVMEQHHHNHENLQDHGYTIISTLLSSSSSSSSSYPDDDDITFMAIQHLGDLFNQQQQQELFSHVKSTLVNKSFTVDIMQAMEKVENNNNNNNHHHANDVREHGCPILSHLLLSSSDNNPEDVALIMQHLIDLFNGPDEDSAMYAKAMVINNGATTGCIMKAVFCAMNNHLNHTTVQMNGITILHRLAETSTEYAIDVIAAGGLEALGSALGALRSAGVSYESARVFSAIVNGIIAQRLRA